MASIPSPILIFGDPYVSKNNIIAAKKKFPNFKWVTKSATNDTLNVIRMEAGSCSWDDSEKMVVIQELPNRKNVREFLLDLCKTAPKTTKIIIWDSTNQIKIDPKSRTIESSWSDFVSEMSKIPGSKIVNNGEQLNEKEGEDSVNFIIKKFENKGKVIENREARLLLSIVGHDRGMLDSEIRKMVLTCPDFVTAQFIVDNAFPSTKEAVLYKLANVMDTNSYEACIDTMERFLLSGINPNVIAEIIVKKARWQMVATHLWYTGITWDDIPDKIMEMGKFPSAIWHDFQIDSKTKKGASDPYQSPNGILGYMTEQCGLPDRLFHIEMEKVKEDKPKTRRKGAEVLPMRFMAVQVVDFVKNRVIGANKDVPMNVLKEKALDRALRVYLFVQDKLVDIRFGENPEMDLQEMVAAIMSTRLI